jgi:hypothetical protein
MNAGILEINPAIWQFYATVRTERKFCQVHRFRSWDWSDFRHLPNRAFEAGRSDEMQAEWPPWPAATVTKLDALTDTPEWIRNVSG